jgi:hypothetical protein
MNKIERTSSTLSSDDLPVRVALEYQMIRETIPGPMMSDDATKLFLSRLEEVARTVGAEKFHAIILHIIDNFDRRPTVAHFRRLAGLNNRLDPQQEEVVVAWALVVKILTRHIGRDGEGHVVLQDRVDEAVPAIPQGVKDAVKLMGGWSALYESWPAYAGQKWMAFKDLYRGDPVTALVVK